MPSPILHDEARVFQRVERVKEAVRLFGSAKNFRFALDPSRIAPPTGADTKPGERPYLVARVGLNRGVLLEAAASAAGGVKSGSGGRI